MLQHYYLPFNGAGDTKVLSMGCWKFGEKKEVVWSCPECGSLHFATQQSMCNNGKLRGPWTCGKKKDCHLKDIQIVFEGWTPPLSQKKKGGK